MRYIYFLLFLLLWAGGLQAQTTCGAVADYSWESPAFNLQRQDGALKPAATLYVPVVFHIIHNGGSENVADTFINRLLNELNGKFANTGIYNRPGGQDIGIQFCLADEDTSGNPTTGITRDSTPASNMYLYTVQNGLPVTYPVDSLITWNYHWNTTKYLNIYLVKNAMVDGTGHAGFAYYPNSHGTYRDGVFIDYDYVNPQDAVFYQYDIIAHETGHYLGLYHTFEFGCTNNDCMNDNDQVCDTPPDNLSDTACVANSCTTDSDDASANNPFRSIANGGIGDQPDDTRNYMDYSKCVERFTNGQRVRMVAALSTSRASLLTANVCAPVSAVSSLQEAGGFSVSPNPCYNHVSVKAADGGQYRIMLINAIGQVVYDAGFTGEKTIATEALPAGLYIYVISGQGGVRQSGKIVKQ